METINETILRRANERERLYKQELKKQVRSWETYFDQLGNILAGVIRISGWWFISTVVFTASAVLIWFICDDFTVYPYAEIRETLRGILIICGGASAMACILTNTGHFKNLFNINAEDHASRHIELHKQVELVESVLVRHDLINETDMKERIYEDSIKALNTEIPPAGDPHGQ